MKTFLVIWIGMSLFLFGFSQGQDYGCKKDSMSIPNPIVFLAWPAASIAIATGWKHNKKDVCDATIY